MGFDDNVNTCNNKKESNRTRHLGLGELRTIKRFKIVLGLLNQLTSWLKFRALEFGSRPMAQSRQSTSGIVVKAGLLPGAEVTMQSSKPEEVFLTSLTYQ